MNLHHFLLNGITDQEKIEIEANPIVLQLVCKAYNIGLAQGKREEVERAHLTKPITIQQKAAAGY